MENKYKIDYGKFDTKTFVNNKPFPNLTIDYLFQDRFLDEILDNYPDESKLNWWKYDNHFEKKLAFNNVSTLHESFQKYFNLVNSREFVNHLEKLTGITGLVADPSLYGGGLHKINRGGKLDVHADFNYHKITGWKRRLNLITFLNRDWKSEYGGYTEYWDTSMTKCVKKVLPVFNRTVIFCVDKDSYHGHPEPLLCPPDMCRRSLATYYYTLHDEKIDDLDYHSTDYKRRPSEEINEKVEKMREQRRKGRLEDMTT